MVKKGSANEKTKRMMFVGFAMVLFLMLCAATGVMPMNAIAIETTGVETVMDFVVGIVGTAAKYVGAAISLWGIFQIIMAFRREDSEGISKNIISVVVGALLIAFGLGAGEVMGMLIG